jgi:hypothetical protein
MVKWINLFDNVSVMLDIDWVVGNLFQQTNVCIFPINI